MTEFISGTISTIESRKNPIMNPKERSDKEQNDNKKSEDVVETPPPPQHMDPSKKPGTEKTGHDRKSGDHKKK